jgi:hypothetical protein
MNVIEKMATEILGWSLINMTTYTLRKRVFLWLHDSGVQFKATIMLTYVPSKIHFPKWERTYAQVISQHSPVDHFFSV